MAKAKEKPHYTVLFSGDINHVRFKLWGDNLHKTKVYKFFDQDLDDNDLKKVLGVLGFIDLTYPNCSHEKKFKHLVDDIWSIKAGGQVRIACFWDANTLIGIYGIIKKVNAWPDQEVKNAKSQKKLYMKTLES